MILTKGILEKNMYLRSRAWVSIIRVVVVIVIVIVTIVTVISGVISGVWWIGPIGSVITGCLYHTGWKHEW